MKYFVLTLTMCALLFNAAVAQAAMVHDCSHHEAKGMEVMQMNNTQDLSDAEAKPCHSDMAEKTTPQQDMQTAEKSCCGDVCLCLAKATIKTIDATSATILAGLAISKKPILGANTAALDAELFAENPPPKFFVA